MMSLDIERMMMQQMFNEWMLKILRKQPFRGVPLKRSFLKKVKSWKRPAYIFIFLKNCRWKACSLAKNNSFNFFFKDFALYVLRFLNILKIFILQNTYQWVFASRSNFKNPPEVFCKIWCSKKFHKFHRKTAV